MNSTNNNVIPRIAEVVSKNNTGAIFLTSNPSLDSIAASTALYLALTQLGKHIALVSEGKAEADLTAVEKIQTTLLTGGDNLVISFPYTDGSIDKVDYNIQGSNFNLIITPREGYPKVGPDQVKYSYSGGIVDYIITIDTPTLNNLGSAYSENQPQFQGKEIINIDRHLTNTNFGTVNYVDKTISSVSEMILNILQGLNIEFDRDIATNLYAGISTATNNFTSYSVNASTFENAAFLLRKGALKKLLRKPGSPSMPQPFGKPKYQSVQKYHEQQPVSIPAENVKPIEAVEKESTNQEKNPPTDRLKPKIFRGGGLI